LETPGWLSPLSGRQSTYAGALGIRGCWAVAAEPVHPRHDLLTAVATLGAFGAQPLARLIRVRLRDVGVARIPRGAAGSTWQNPHGLTERQWEVARLLAGNLTNAEIANRLVVSVRTVENHVAAILQKVGARSRRDASAMVADLRVGTTDRDRKP
jgi:DNA-binding NarL/FixJ family response regulator